MPVKTAVICRVRHAMRVGRVNDISAAMPVEPGAI
jgi:hypothetical protein